MYIFLLCFSYRILNLLFYTFRFDIFHRWPSNNSATIKRTLIEWCKSMAFVTTRRKVFGFQPSCRCKNVSRVPKKKERLLKRENSIAELSGRCKVVTHRAGISRQKKVLLASGSWLKQYKLPWDRRMHRKCRNSRRNQPEGKVLEMRCLHERKLFPK